MNEQLSLLARLQRSWREETRIYRSPDVAAAEIRAKHLGVVTGLTPLLMGANLINVSMVLVALWASAPRWALLGWAVLVLGMCAVAARGWLRWRRKAPG